MEALTARTLPKLLAQGLGLLFLAVGCWWVLSPFIAALLFAAVIVICTWRPYRAIKRRLAGRAGWSALVMVLLLIFLVLMPLALLTASAAQGVDLLRDWASALIERGIPTALPAWVGGLPLIGDTVVTYWGKLLGNKQEWLSLIEQIRSPLGHILWEMVRVVGVGLLQFSLALFMCFFLYRDGETIGQLGLDAARKLAGPVGVRLLLTARNTISGVMIGLTGTAAGQALAAAIGFVIVGAPAPLLLSLAVFLLSVVPVGPPLVWGSVATWLYLNGSTGLAVFEVLWGLLVVSSVDNFLKPVLISQSADLPLLLIALGVFGGLAAFGFIGMFLGPTLLALAFLLVKHWLCSKRSPQP